MGIHAGLILEECERGLKLYCVPSPLLNMLHYLWDIYFLTHDCLVYVAVVCSY